MKNIYFLVMAAFYALPSHGQMTDAPSARPLTAQELSQQLAPPYRQMAFQPATAISLEAILKRRADQAGRPLPKLSNADSLDVTLMKIPGLHSGDPEIPVCIYKPKRIVKAPIYLFFHGGGFVEGNMNWDHQRCANIAQRAGVVVISVDYRLAPEHVFPAALDDGYSTLCWAFRRGAAFGGDTSKIIVAGISAGAGLAGGIAWRARDEQGPRISMQVLEVPPCDVDTNRLSVRAFYNMPGLKGADLSILLRIYLGDAAYKMPLPKYLLPGLNPDLRGLPPAFIVTASVDPLRDGGLAYAIRLLQAGVQVDLHNFAGYVHGGLPSFEVDLYRVMNQFLH